MPIFSILLSLLVYLLGLLYVLTLNAFVTTYLLSVLCTDIWILFTSSVCLRIKKVIVFSILLFLYLLLLDIDLTARSASIVIARVVVHVSIWPVSILRRWIACRRPVIKILLVDLIKLWRVIRFEHAFITFFSIDQLRLILLCT